MYSVVPFLRVWGFFARSDFSLTVYNFHMKNLRSMKIYNKLYNISEMKLGKFEASNTNTLKVTRSCITQVTYQSPLVLMEIFDL